MNSKKPSIAINGLGRIGRLLLRYAIKDFDISLVNATRSAKDLAYFLKYDSVHGVWREKIQGDDNQYLNINSQKIPVFQADHPDKLSWEGVDIVFECTGRFKNKKDWEKAFSKGVKKVMVSAPSDSADLTLVYGVNDNQYDNRQHHFISNASCTTNCLAPLISVIKESYGVKRVSFSTIHSYTNDQKLLDASHKDLRRSRAAALNIIPTSTGAAKSLSLIFPELKTQVQGLAFRVPTANVSLVDLIVETEKKLLLDKVKQKLKEKSEGALKGVLAYEETPLVSSDFIGRTESSLLDSSLCSLQGDRLLRLIAWYDNEAGFTQRMLDFVLKNKI